MFAGYAAGPVESAYACEITTPANITEPNDPGQATRVVNYGPPTTSGMDCGTVSCSPASGNPYPIGVTTVKCAGDGDPGSQASFTITVVDVEAPSITAPANRTVGNDPGQAFARVTYPAPVATDNAPGASAACSPLSSSLFPLGQTAVTCTARDAAGNTASAPFTITVKDLQPPVFVPPKRIDRTAATSVGGVSVVYDTPAAYDNSRGKVAVSCTPASMTRFRIGTTTVTCVGKDPSGNTARTTFPVVVTAVRFLPPAIQGIFLSADRFAVGRVASRAGRVPRGTRVAYVLSQPARVRLAIKRCTRRRGGRCRRYAPVGTLRLKGTFGLNRLAFRGIVKGKRLRPGLHRMTFTAIDARGRKSRPRSASFTIVPRGAAS